MLRKAAFFFWGGGWVWRGKCEAPRQQQTTTNNNNKQQQQTTTNNNKQQQTTTNNNKQQQTTTNNNKQQPQPRPKRKTTIRSHSSIEDEVFVNIIYPSFFCLDFFFKFCSLAEAVKKRQKEKRRFRMPQWGVRIQQNNGSCTPLKLTVRT